MEKKYNFRQVERELDKLWEEQEIYKYQNGKRGKIYSIDTPPPMVSGKLHIGHVFSYTQAEMIARFKRMQGYDVFYPFGFDDNGLPTERLVERDEKIRAKMLPRSEFRRDYCSRRNNSGKYFIYRWYASQKSESAYYQPFAGEGPVDKTGKNPSHGCYS